MANLAQFFDEWAELAVLLAPRILIFSIVLAAEYLSYVKSIRNHARAFLTLTISSIGTVLTEMAKICKSK